MKEGAHMRKTLQKLLGTLSANVPDIPFEVRYWDGEAERFGSGLPVFTLTVNSRQAVKSLFSRGSMGFGEEYVAGTIDVEGDFQELVRLGMDPRFQNIRFSLRTKAAVLIQHLRSLNTVKRSPRNIAQAYDLGLDFYRQYLDESLTYSCAYFRSEKDSLDQAQQQKYEHICRKLRLTAGETLVDIGCGWGGMLLYAARHYGVKGLGCTLSVSQAEYVKEKAALEGLEGKIKIIREDYRNMEGQFDKFVSIGMFEHVGKRYIPTFMEKTKSILKPGGMGLLHTVGKEADTARDAWTMRYIFPGAYIPILDHVVRAMGENGLVPVDIENLRLHYAATLDEWARRFEANADRIEEAFGRRFVRMWRMFLRGSAGAFRWGTIRAYQILFTNGLNNSLPLTREHVYRM
jgi:cyclopropane-fatty-acyl-phospholipid synthase